MIWSRLLLEIRMMRIKLTDLNPRFYSIGGEGVTNSKTGEPLPELKGMGITFDCPCGKCGERPGIPFTNPISGGKDQSGVTWKRTGETIEDLSLTPSIRRMGGCKWHGFLTDGIFVEC